MMLALLIVGVTAGGILMAAAGSKLLLGWYLHEARRLDIPQQPADAVITYPLA